MERKDGACLSETSGAGQDTRYARCAVGCYNDRDHLREARIMVRCWLLLGCCSLLVALPVTQVKTTGQPAADSDWPLFRGDPLQTGVAKSALPDKLEIRWKVDLKKGIESTAAIAAGTVYVGCYDGHLHAFDLATGKPKWKTKLGPIKAPPSVYKDRVYVGDE